MVSLNLKAEAKEKARLGKGARTKVFKVSIIETTIIEVCGMRFRDVGFTDSSSRSAILEKRGHVGFYLVKTVAAENHLKTGDTIIRDF